jgi:hypothetical protein
MHWPAPTLLVGACMVIAGCGASIGPTPFGEPVSSVAITGSVHGGQQPIAGAQIVLYAVGTAGNGSAANSAMHATVYTDSQGNFTLTNTYNCPTSTSEMYVVSIGGNPGLPSTGGVTPNNTAATLMAGLGQCGSLTPSTIININELTTVSSVAALAPFMSSYSAIGYASSSATQFAAAMSSIGEYTNTATGTVPGPALPNGYTASSAAVTTLANVIAACINTSGGTASQANACGSLFTLATSPNGAVASDTIGAVLNILENPANNVLSIYNLAGSASPFQPGLTAAPANWSLPLVANGAGSAQFANATYTVQEGLTYLSIPVTLSNSNSAGTVTYTTCNGTAAAGNDFQATSGTLSWAAGTNTAQTILIPLLNPGNSSGGRVFTVTLSSPQGGISLGANAATTITVNGSTIASEVAALPATTSVLAIKKAALTWWLNAAYSTANEGNTNQSTSLLSDIANALTETFTVPSTLPPGLFPTVPSIASNPSVTAANSVIASNLASAAATPVLYDTPYSADTVTGPALETGEDMLSALVMPGQSYYLNASLVPALLNTMENAAVSIPSNYGDFQDDSEFAVLYLMLTQGWPQLVPPTLQASWKSVVANNTAAVLSQEGAHFSNSANNASGVPGDLANDWINADVRNLMAVVYGEMIAGTPLSSNSPYLVGGLNEMKYSLLPDGGTDYTDQQNEAFNYHSSYVREMSRYGLITGDTTGTTLAAGTRFYTPLSLIFPAVGEYVTAPSWKDYWNENTNNESMEIVVGLTGDPTSAYQLKSVGYPASYYDASFYAPNATATAQPASWITYDGNAEGPRGVQGTFAFMSTTRPTPVSNRGKPTYVGGIVLNSANSGAGWTLNAAVESAGAVVLKTSGAELVNASSSGATANLLIDAQNEYNAQTTTSTFGAVSSVNNLSGYETSATSWTQREAWVLLPTRVIGLVTVSNSAPESDFEFDGGFKLVAGREFWGTQKTFTQLATNEWQYGNMVVQVYANDYAGSRTELTSTWEDTSNKAGWLLLTDANNSAGSAHTFPAGSSHFFLADFRPSTSGSASSVQQLSLANGLQGFTFVDGGVTYTMVQNITPNPLSYTAPTGATVTMSGAQYRPPWINITGNQSIPSATYAGIIPAHSHIVMTQ